MSRHDKLPLRVSGIHEDEDGRYLEIRSELRPPMMVAIAEVRCGYGGSIEDEQQDCARRMVACWNACRNLSTGLLEEHPEEGVFQILKAVAAQRDELLDTLNHIACAAMDISCERRSIATAARDAIAKTKAAA